MKTVSIIIPNWNGQGLLAKNIPSVLTAAERLGRCFSEFILVDDGSADNSVDYVKKYFPAIKIVALPKNKGFHTATNTGFRTSTADIAILLNSDIEPKADSFEPLIRHFSNPNVFAASGRIYSGDKKTFLYGNRGGYFKHGHFYLFEKEEFSRSQTLFACGGAGAFCRRKFLSLGGFDTLFSPFYYEEQDVSYRALKRGWNVVYEPASLMYHQVRATINKKSSAKRLSYISARNNYLFAFKNITDPLYTLQMFLFIPLFLLRDLFKRRFRFWIALTLAFLRLPQAIFKRVKEQKHNKFKDAYILSLVNQK